MAGLLTGLLGSAFGGSPGSDSTFGERMAMNFAPQMYAAMQQRQQQKATEDALSQMGGQLPPGMASGMAKNPQLLQQAGAAYLPSAPEMKQIPGPFGTTSLLQTKTQPGGNISATPLAVGGAPATTANPGAPAAVAPAAPAGTIPGSTGNIQDQIMAARKAGASRDQLLTMIPGSGADLVKSVLDGTQTVKDLATRGVGDSDRTSVIRLAHLVDPNWDENRSESLNKYRQGYMATGTQGTVGFQRQAYGTTLQHLDTALDSALDMHQSDADIAPAAHLENRIRAMGGDQSGKVNNFDTKTGLLAAETDKFISGKAATEGGTKEQKSKWDVNATPRETAGAAQAYLDMLQGKVKDMEDERNANFGGGDTAKGAEAAKAYPIQLPEHEAKIASIQSKIAKLRDYGQAQVSGAPATPPPAAGGWKLPIGWSVK